jgi:hypothetical protein
MVFGREPALFLTLTAALISLAMAFGLKLTDLQLAGINAGILAVVSFAVRQSVTPVSKIG